MSDTSRNLNSQSLSVKRAQVEFHNFASLGQPDRALQKYEMENIRRGALIRKHLPFIGPMTPFLEIGANVGHTSYLLANEFGARGYALDISADALRHGRFLMDHFGYTAAPVRVAGDALNLPFRDGTMRFVMTHQTLSQFQDIDAVFREVHRVLAPGGVFFFSEEPIRRILTLRMYRTPYYDTMKPWERALYDRGLLGFVAKDVIGARQEESFGIRQNHRMGLKDWHKLIGRYFTEQAYEIFVVQTGVAERWVRALGRMVDRHGSDWVPARLLGGTVAAFCRKAGTPEPIQAGEDTFAFESLLRCPDCGSSVSRDAEDSIVCGRCGYKAAYEGGVYNLIQSVERKNLYPGDSPDTIEFSQPDHEAKLLDGWHKLEGVFGGKYRWIGGEPARARLVRVHSGPQRLRIRGHAHEKSLGTGQGRVIVRVNGELLKEFALDRTGLFILEADLPDANEYVVELQAQPVWQQPPDNRYFTVQFSMLRLVDRE